MPPAGSSARVALRPELRDVLASTIRLELMPAARFRIENCDAPLESCGEEVLDFGTTHGRIVRH
jgi:hypothetical protein